MYPLIILLFLNIMHNIVSIVVSVVFLARSSDHGQKESAVAFLMMVLVGMVANVWFVVLLWRLKDYLLEIKGAIRINV